MIGRAFRRILSGPEPEDIIVGDMVRVVGYRGVSIVEEINGDVAIICREPGKREIHQIRMLCRVKQRGALYDAREWG